MGSPLRSSATHVFVDSLAPTWLDVSDEDRHHLDRVLRLRRGEEVTASDGRGHWCRCRYAGSGRLEVEAPAEFIEAASPTITIGFALTKGDRPEWIVQKLTEVGVDHIAPFVGSRTVVRWDAERADRHIGRLRAIARSAAMQSRRVWLPAVDDVRSFDSLATDLAGHGALAQPGGRRLSLARPAMLIGPEGGFTEAEAGCGLPAIDLGPSVLRAETAALAAGILLCALRVGLVSTAS